MNNLQENWLGSISFLGKEKTNWSEIIGSLVAGIGIVITMILALIVL